MLEVKRFQTLLASVCLRQGGQAKLPAARNPAVGEQKVREESWLVRCCPQAGVGQDRLHLSSF